VGAVGEAPYGWGGGDGMETRATMLPIALVNAQRAREGPVVTATASGSPGRMSINNSHGTLWRLYIHPTRNRDRRTWKTACPSSGCLSHPPPPSVGVRTKIAEMDALFQRSGAKWQSRPYFPPSPHSLSPGPHRPRQAMDGGMHSSSSHSPSKAKTLEMNARFLQDAGWQIPNVFSHAARSAAKESVRSDAMAFFSTCIQAEDGTLVMTIYFSCGSQRDIFLLPAPPLPIPFLPSGAAARVLSCSRLFV
jgi:hypothetical protein